MRLDAVRQQDPRANRRLAVCIHDLHSLPAGARQLVEHLRRAGSDWAPMHPLARLRAGPLELDPRNVAVNLSGGPARLR